VASEMTFRHHGQCVFQIQLAHRQDAVPLTRDYLHPAPPAAKPQPTEPAPRRKRQPAVTHA
jgi:hypothetical protein